MKYAALGPIAIHYPEKVETNEDLRRAYPGWDMDLIYEKTGIAARYIAAPDECASDLGVAASRQAAPMGAGLAVAVAAAAPATAGSSSLLGGKG